MKKRKRQIPILFWVSEEERKQIEQKMAQLGTGNMSAYLRKIAIDGYVVNLDLPELRELTTLLRRSGNNLDQRTQGLHETARIYDADMESLLVEYAKLMDAADVILSKLASIK